jgi:hypothetical protein
MNKQKEISEKRHREFRESQSEFGPNDEDLNLMSDSKLFLVDLLHGLALSSKAELLGKITLDVNFNDLRDRDYKDLMDLFMSDASEEDIKLAYQEMVKLSKLTSHR